MIQAKVQERYSSNGMFVHETELFEQEAKIAVEMINRIGLVAATDDGEDTSGRHKFRLLQPEEVVQRAFDIAKLIMVEARKRNLVYAAPDIKEFDRKERTPSS